VRWALKGALDSQVIKFTSYLPMVGGSLRVLQLLSHFKTGRHDIAEILLKVPLDTKNQSIKKNYSASLRFIYYWLIDLLLLNVQWAVYQLYSGRKQVQQNLIIILKWGRGGPTQESTFDCHWKSIESCALMKNSGYNVPYFYQHLQERSLTCNERGALQTRYPVWSIVRLTVL
jgi:hypothetical protein